MLDVFSEGMAEDREGVPEAGLERIEAKPNYSVDFHRLGFVSGEEKGRCFVAADLFIAAGLWESFGLTVLEAMVK